MTKEILCTKSNGFKIYNKNKVNGLIEVKEDSLMTLLLDFSVLFLFYLSMFSLFIFLLTIFLVAELTI